MRSPSALLTRAWYAPEPTLVAQSLRPLSWVFGALAALRRAAYRHGVLHTVRVPVPVIVVGNITAGGAGKTPLVAALVEALRERGRHPAIVSRGYGRSGLGIREVDANDAAADTGDEPLILAATGVPVFVGEDRAATAQRLLAAHPDVDVIVADDGLQHYALARDVEIAVVDASVELGNRLLLPAGPLREPASRLATVDAVVRLLPEASSRISHESDVAIGRRSRSNADIRADAAATRPRARAFAMTHEAQPWRNLADPGLTFDPAALRDRTAVAIAGIAHPQRFFDALRAHGFAGRTQAFADHHRYSRSDVGFPGARALLMTEKDAVKCRAFADARMWMLPIRARVDRALIDLVMEKLDGSEAARDARLSGHQGTARP